MVKGVIRMHKHKKGKKTFWRYMFSYLFIFFIPFALFQIVFQIYFSPIYQREVEANLRQTSDKIGQSIDWQMSQIDSLVTQVRLSPKFGAAYAEDSMNQIEMRDQLQMLLSGNNLLFAINYYQKKSAGGHFLPVCYATKNLGSLSFFLPQLAAGGNAFGFGHAVFHRISLL